MDQEYGCKPMSCPTCGGSRWWRSRTGWRICAQCHPDALEALQVLTTQVRATPTGGRGLVGQRSTRCPSRSSQSTVYTVYKTHEGRHPVGKRLGEARRAIAVDQPYPVLPPLPPEEYTALKANFATRGVLVPAEEDDECDKQSSRAAARHERVAGGEDP
jgi:hypothetical protein